MKNTSKPLVVIPPHITSFEEVVSKTGPQALFFLSNPVWQKKFFLQRNLAIVTTEEILEANALVNVNQTAKHFATQWCFQGYLKEKLCFCGVNMGSLFFIEYTYFFIGVLKAFHLAEAMIRKWQGTSDFFLVDDGTYWSRVFKYVTSAKKVRLQLLPCKPDLLMGESETKNLQKTLRGWVKDILGFLKTPSLKNLQGGGILYSAAPRYVEPLWKFDRGALGYYLRPEYSVKIARQIKDQFPHMSHILPSRIGDVRPRSALRQWMRQSHFPQCVADYFNENDFFTYQRINLWSAIQNDFLTKLKDRVLQKGGWVYSLDQIIRYLKPKMIVVDEDVTVFGQALIEKANLEKIPSIQIQHGIPEPDNHLIPIRTTKLLVPGEASRKRMIEMGAQSETVEVLGAPHYAARFLDIPKDRYKDEVYKDLDISKDFRIVTLITHNFLTEEKPDWIGAIDHPGHIQQLIQMACRSVKGLENVKLVIKLHPRDHNEWFTHEVLEGEEMSKKAVVLKNYDSVKLFCGSSLILSGLSTTYYEALLLDRPIFIFDDSRNRKLAFMSDEYLDLATPEVTVALLRKIILEDDLRAGRLKRQQLEKNFHFLNANAGSVERFWKLLNGLCQVQSKERYQHV